MRHPQTLEKGARTYLRAPTPADEREFLALVLRSRAHLRPFVHPIQTARQFESYLERISNPRVVGTFLCRIEDDAIVGVANLSEIIHGLFRSAYLGYYLGAPFARQGYMTEGIDLVLRHAFVALKLHRLEANVQPENSLSLRLVERCGFRKEGYSPRYLKIGGRWRDHERWAILAEDWRTRRRPAGQGRGR